MGRFGRVLRRVDRRLEAPEPERSRILVEVAADLEDLYRAYRERGFDEAEARRRAVEWFDLSPEVVDSLRVVHTPWIERLLRRSGRSARGWIELGAAALFSLAAAGAGLSAVFRTGLLPSPSPAAWAIAALAAVGLGAGVARGYRLFVRGDRPRSGWRRGRHTLLAAAAAAALTGLLAGGLRLTTRAVGTAERAAGIPWSEVAAASALATLGLSASLILALVWLLLRVRAEVVDRAVERARSEFGEALEPADLEPMDDDETGLQQEATG